MGDIQSLVGKKKEPPIFWKMEWRPPGRRVLTPALKETEEKTPAFCRPKGKTHSPQEDKEGSYSSQKDGERTLSIQEDKWGDPNLGKMQKGS